MSRKVSKRSARIVACIISALALSLLSSGCDGAGNASENDIAKDAGGVEFYITDSDKYLGNGDYTFASRLDGGSLALAGIGECKLTNEGITGKALEIGNCVGMTQMYSDNSYGTQREIYYIVPGGDLTNNIKVTTSDYCNSIDYNLFWVDEALTDEKVEKFMCDMQKMYNINLKFDDNILKALNTLYKDGENSDINITYIDDLADGTSTESLGKHNELKVSVRKTYSEGAVWLHLESHCISYYN